MTKGVVHRLAKALHSRSKGSLAFLKKVGDAPIKVGLVAAILFVLAYAVETKAVLVLEASPNLFEAMGHHSQSGQPITGPYDSQ